MSLIFLESWDNIATADLPAKGWNRINTQNTATPAVSATQVRTGPSSLALKSTSDTGNDLYYQYQGAVRRALGVGAHATVIVGFACYVPHATRLFELWSGGSRQITVMVNDLGQIVVRRPAYNSTILGTSTTSITFNAWNYIEVKITASATVGTVDVHVNGTNVLSLTGQNTGNVAVYDSLDLASGMALGGLTLYYDDVYVANGAGAINNNFLGDMRVRSLAPSGNGASSQLVGSDGNSIDNYLLVDDPVPATVDYVGSATLDQKDTYAFGDLPDASGTVLGVQVNAHATKTDSGARNLALVTRSGAADHDGPDAALPFGSNVIVQHLRELNPATAAAWTLAAVNAAEFGAKVR